MTYADLLLASSAYLRSKRDDLRLSKATRNAAATRLSEIETERQRWAEDATPLLDARCA